MKPEALLILAASAPKHPDPATLADWEKQFRVDYPEPWCPEYNVELQRANIACIKAYSAACISSDLPLPYVGPYTACFAAWAAWRNECRDKFIRDEWPLVWARRLANCMEN